MAPRSRPHEGPMHLGDRSRGFSSPSHFRIRVCLLPFGWLSRCTEAVAAQSRHAERMAGGDPGNAGRESQDTNGRRTCGRSYMVRRRSHVAPGLQQTTDAVSSYIHNERNYDTRAMRGGINLPEVLDYGSYSLFTRFLNIDSSGLR